MLLSTLIAPATAVTADSCMSIQDKLEEVNEGAQTVVQATEADKHHLKARMARTRRRLQIFEDRHVPEICFGG